MSLSDIFMIGFFVVWFIGLGLLHVSSPKMNLTWVSSTINMRNGDLDKQSNPRVSRAFLYILIYVGASALGVNGWNGHFLEGNIILVILETTLVAAILFLIAFEIIPITEKLHPSDYGVHLDVILPENFDKEKYTNPWTHKVQIPGYVSPTTSLLVAIVLAIPIALIFQVPLYILQYGFFPLGFGFVQFELAVPNILLGFSSAVIEEILYRGIFLTALNIISAQRGKPAELSNNILQALLFTSLHPLYLTGLALNQTPQINALIIYLIQAFLIAVFLGLIKAQTKSLIPGIVIHSVINLVGTLMI